MILKNQFMKGRINIITLGCSKNLVDSEYLLRQLYDAGYEVMYDEDKEQSDVVILNTCGFILDAKEESINAILEQIRRKNDGDVGKVVVMGCLSERYKDELSKEMPEVDAFFGVWDHKEIIEYLGVDFQSGKMTDRYITTPSHYAYLKISEGCNRQCAFCAIPGIRGKQVSKRIEDLYTEAKNFAGRGVQELILIAQDLTNYGIDLYGKRNLAELLEKLSEIDELEWIRLHYAYPTGFPEEVIEVMLKNPKVCKYMDIPIQHINSRILNEMNRGHDRKSLEDLLAAFRRQIPDVALRTTILVGFPGETEEEFDELYRFVEKFRFDRLGVFSYSHEDDTPAANMDDNVSEEVKQDRADRIMSLQQQISLEKNAAKVGKTMRVLIDRQEPDYFVGRTEFDSPEVDNEVLISTERDLELGAFYNVKIIEAEEFDLIGEIE